ncbi:uncharacterized protein LOC143788833 [Ranitomeya variabilis]|uniref:uncharacterized protein LOC143788833 n=1 Tax=Ranitomeya variabilis TaxID=490064 RepID=UPI004055DF89
MTRPDIEATIGIPYRCVEKPHQKHWNAVKRVLQYLKETQEIHLRICATGELKLTGYVDADWAGDLNDPKSTSGYLFKLGESSISCSSRKQVSVSLSCHVISSTEAEYVSAAHASQK